MRRRAWEAQVASKEGMREATAGSGCAPHAEAAATRSRAQQQAAVECHAAGAAEIAQWPSRSTRLCYYCPTPSVVIASLLP